MLEVVTGVPGASKTAFVVTKLDEIERKNKINLEKNKVVFEYNKPLFDKFRDDFSYREYETGSAHELKRNLEVLPNDYFDFICQDFDDLRPDYYFQRSTYYNEIIERINEREGKQKFEYLQPVRTIYSNINALKIDNTRAMIYDWRDAPDGSIFAIDEVQNVEPYNTDSRKKEPIIQDLTVHRHRGFDFYFITQFPTFLNTTIQNLCGLHSHITRPYGRTPRVYQYGSIKLYPGSPLNKFNCESKYSFSPQQRIFKLYKSTTINTHKKRTPQAFKMILPAVLVVGGIFYWGYSDRQKAHDLREQKKQDVQASASPVASDLDCKKAENLDKKECKDFYDKATKDHADIVASNYDPSKPYDFDVQQPYKVVNQPKFSGCMKKGAVYVAYTEQGTILKDVLQSDCKRLLNDGDRPYDYFGDHKPIVVQQKSANSDYSEIAKVREIEADQQSKDAYSENLLVKDSRNMMSDDHKFKNYDDQVLGAYK